MPDVVRVYCDSCVFCYRIARNIEKIGILEQWSERAERGEVAIVTSALTVAEVAKIDDGSLPEEQEEKIVQFFENPYILIVQLDRAVATKARELVRLYGFKGADAVHVASAILSRVSVMHTYDLRIIGKAKYCQPLRIEEPKWKDEQPGLMSVSTQAAE